MIRAREQHTLKREPTEFQAKESLLIPSNRHLSHILGDFTFANLLHYIFGYGLLVLVLLQDVEITTTFVFSSILSGVIMLHSCALHGLISRPPIAGTLVKTL